MKITQAQAMYELPEYTVQEENVKITIVGPPKAIKVIMDRLHDLHFAKLNECREIKQGENPSEVMIVMTKTLYI